MSNSFHSLDMLPEFIAARDLPEQLQSLSHRALEKMQSMEWPSTEDEVWRRSNLSYLDYGSFALQASEHSAFGASLQSPNDVDKAASFSRLGRDGADLQQNVLALLEQGLDEATHKVAIWHYASMSDLYLLHIPKGLQIEEPFLLNVHTGGDANLAVPHLLVIAEDGCDVKVIIETSSTDEAETLYNEHITVSLGKKARCRIMAMNTMNTNSTVFSEVSARVEQGGWFEHCYAPLGTMLTASCVDVSLMGEDAEVLLQGLYFSHLDQHISMRTFQRHCAANAYSRTLYKGAIQDEAHTVYQGLIQVAENAGKTDAYLTNNNIILSHDARADSIPSLQIRTNDVRCSHGSTTGKLSEKHLFYLKSRGFSPEEAHKMLIRAHFEPILADYPPYFVDKVDRVLNERMAMSDVA